MSFLHSLQVVMQTSHLVANMCPACIHRYESAVSWELEPNFVRGADHCFCFTNVSLKTHTFKSTNKTIYARCKKTGTRATMYASST
jgi:hypothetical protein